ncbi:MAG: hydroxymethylglutaryl-CoA lyase [Alphaproteobacteria bacterium]|nr:hydroxymethylglutaryl-CoA lyase [Alphaproteobacteria bacterium]
MTNNITLVEVGPRDGLQNEKTQIPTHIKIQLIEKLLDAGHKVIEIGGFVSPKWVPQLADTPAIVDHFTQKHSQSDLRFPVLVPNLKGFQDALNHKAKEIAIFGAASESFSLKNINVSINESFERFKDIMIEAKKNNIKVRGYISCVMGCPYEGDIPLSKVVDVSQRMFDLGCDEISLGDTIGVGTPNKVKDLLKALKQTIPVAKIGVHFHDTYGQALANILMSLEQDVRIIDTSVSGLGGCPYAKGATGNVASEDVLYMLNGMGFETKIDLPKLIEASQFISNFLKRPPNSKVSLAFLAKHGIL